MAGAIGIGESRDLLVELGTEELPAQFLQKALGALPGAMIALLERERLGHGEVRAFGTPRRIALLVNGVASAQPDEEKEVTGPPERIALDPATGSFTQAALKFAARYGAGPSDLRIVEGPKGRAVGLTVRTPGRTAADVLAAVIPEIFSERSLPYPHSMYWGSHTGPFVRPVHWLVVILGSEVVDVVLHGLRSGRATRGHRFHDGAEVQIRDAASYLETLEDRHVTVDPAARRVQLMAGLQRIAGEAGASLVRDDDLVEEVVALTEKPVPVLGSFDGKFLALPEQIVITAMAVHQRYFALRDPATGRLLGSFVAVANTEPKDTAPLRRGFERVLAARLEDARFCYDEDVREPLASRVQSLAGMVFQAGMGSYLDKAERLSRMAPAAAGLLGLEGAMTPAAAEQAAWLCKADLLTKVVFEFPELQGVMGGIYARADAADASIPAAIRDHYKPEGPSDDLPETPAGKLLAACDKMDTLTCFFAKDRKPAGGSDPFGLRRACLGVLRIVLDVGRPVKLSSIVELVYPLVPDPTVSLERTTTDILEFVKGRLEILWKDIASPDLLEAALACGVDDPVTARRRLEALAEFQGSDEFEDLSVAFKRAYRIVRDEGWTSCDVDGALLQLDEERDLVGALSEIEDRVAAAIAAGDFRSSFSEFRRLRDPIDRFFTKVYVNVDDSRVRGNRLAILARVVRTIEPAARLDHVQFTRTKLDAT